jgi:hypothetical protein
MRTTQIRARDGNVRCALQDRWIRCSQADALVRVCERQFSASLSPSSAHSWARARQRRDRLKPPAPYQTWAAWEADLRARGQL